MTADSTIRPTELPRALPHPGPRATERLLVLPTQVVTATHRLQPGERLVDELVRLTTDLGVTSGSVSFSSGTLDPLHYCFPAKGDGQRAAWFSAEHVTADAQLTGGSATIGEREGEPFVHAHLIWKDEHGVSRGGHVWPETLVGSPAPEVTVAGLRHADWESVTDPETMLPAFHPRSRHNAQGSGEDRDFAVARVLPDEDITEAVRRIGREAGFDAVKVVAGLGSFIGAVLQTESSAAREPGQVDRVVVDGPATEVLKLTGTLTSSAPSEVSGEPAPMPELHCTVVDLRGTVHSGYLIPGENHIAVTFELLVESV